MMKKTLSYIQKIILTPSSIKVLYALIDGPRNSIELKNEGIMGVDSMLYFLSIVDIDDTVTPQMYSLTATGMTIAKKLKEFIEAAEASLPGGI